MTTQPDPHSQPLPLNITQTPLADVSAAATDAAAHPTDFAAWPSAFAPGQHDQMQQPIDLDAFHMELQPAEVPHSSASQNAMSAAIVFIVVIVGLWAVLGYMHSMAKTLSSVDATNQKLIVQLSDSGEGLKKLEKKTSVITTMSENSGKLNLLMTGINEGMGGMLGGVDNIGTQMATLNESLKLLDSEVGQVAPINTKVASKLNGINDGLAQSNNSVSGMKVDIVKTSKALTGVPPYLVKTNARLAHVNGVVSYMGVHGVQSPLSIHVTFLGIPNGGAVISATMIPQGAWL